MDENYLIYFRPDLTEYITQEFVRNYSVDTTSWVKPIAYYDQNEDVFKSDGGIPDGTYIMMGHVEYSSSNKLYRHKVGQFIGVLLQGINFVGTQPLAYYPHSKDIVLNPVYALLRVGETQDFKKVGVITEDLNKRILTELHLVKEIAKYHPHSVESKVYRLRMALHRQLRKTM